MDMVKSEKRQVLRAHLWSILHNGRGNLGHAFNFCSVILILLSVAIFGVHFLPSYPAYDTFVNELEAFIVGCFTLEYFLRIYASPRRWHYIFSFYGIIDLLSIVPFYTSIFTRSTSASCGSFVSSSWAIYHRVQTTAPTA